MCGICGIVGAADAPQGQPMLDALRHRGPDDEGGFATTSTRGHIWFGHRRLSIIDLTPGGHQPMTSTAGEGELTITFNGEIYNYIELQKELAALGYPFVGRSDTEVVLAAWRVWGEEALTRLRGMFAFAIWDGPRETMWLARDRMGEKPLYYHATPRRLVFASELRSVLASGIVPRVLDRDGLESYLAYGSVTQPYTLVQDVRILGAGEVLKYHNGQTHIRRYWSRPGYDETAAITMSSAEAIALVREALDDAITSCMVADVDIALLLSGGVDSTAILARLTALGYRGITTFTVGFEGGDAALNETEWAACAARHFGSKHHRVIIRTAEVRQLLRAALSAVDLPSIDGFNHYLAFQAIARNGFKVAITGQGADELFYGYARHRVFQMSHRLATLRLPSMVRGPLARTLTAMLPQQQRLRKSIALFAPGSRTELAYATRHLIYTGEEISHLLGRPVEHPVRFVPQAVGDTPIAQLYDIETQHFLRNQLLRDGDQMSMAVSLELRAPFVDHRLVETVMPIPSYLKLQGNRQKALLVDAVADPLVTAAARRPKSGFPLPLRRWVMEELDTGPLLLRTIGLDSARARQVLARGERGIEHQQAWLLSVLGMWMQANAIAPAA